ncbi:hypothetical protein GCM10007857_49970 [Bradyrhizobium iriomotense]|uniref:Uncharacterized protein n=1 Tax=Bradyrhizobium iriomotense TaxID=441950 RepID=A0ABQ6B5W0_9BRAD|nr:hypothetical protein GCM10007857_49970 [Bradyrhizobium iriomotense]
MLPREFRGDAEQPLGAHLSPIVEAVLRLDLVGAPAIHGRSLGRQALEVKKKQIPVLPAIGQMAHRPFRGSVPGPVEPLPWLSRL